MTGNYLYRISLTKNDGLKETALAIHHEMDRQKSNYDCFRFILSL